MHTHGVCKGTGEEVIVSLCELGKDISKRCFFIGGQVAYWRYVTSVRKYCDDVICRFIRLKIVLTQNLKRPVSPPRNNSDPVIILDDQAFCTLYVDFGMCIFAKQARLPFLRSMSTIRLSRAIRSLTIWSFGGTRRRVFRVGIISEVGHFLCWKRWDCREWPDLTMGMRVWATHYCSLILTSFSSLDSALRKWGTHLKNLYVLDAFLETSFHVDLDPFFDNAFNIWERQLWYRQVMPRMKDQNIASASDRLRREEMMRIDWGLRNRRRQDGRKVIFEYVCMLIGFCLLSSGSGISRTEIACRIVLRQVAILRRLDLTKPRTLVPMGGNDNMLVSERIVFESVLAF